MEEIRSILSVAGEDLRTAVIRPLHLTFSDFLVDNKRWTSSAFNIDRGACHLHLAKACLRTLNTQLRRDMCSLGNNYADRRENEDLHSLVGEHIPEHVQYACDSWDRHIRHIKPTGDPIVRQLLEEFIKKKTLQWFEVQILRGEFFSMLWQHWQVYVWTKVSVHLCHAIAPPEVLFYISNK